MAKEGKAAEKSARKRDEYLSPRMCRDNPLDSACITFASMSRPRAHACSLLTSGAVCSTSETVKALAKSLTSVLLILKGLVADGWRTRNGQPGASRGSEPFGTHTRRLLCISSGRACTWPSKSEG
eukprot:6220923-Pyramimonas_sp.AAC.1